MLPIFLLLMTAEPGGNSMQKLIDAAVSHETPKAERRAAIEKLGALGDRAAVVPLVMMLDGNEGSAALAGDVRAALRELRATEVLLAKLAQPAVDEKAMALELIGYWRDPACVPAVIAELAAKDAKLREKAAAVLGRFADPRAVAPLAKLLFDVDADVRMAAAYSLGAIGGVDAVHALEAALARETDGFVKLAFESGLAEAKR